MCKQAAGISQSYLWQPGWQRWTGSPRPCRRRTRTSLRGSAGCCGSSGPLIQSGGGEENQAKWETQCYFISGLLAQCFRIKKNSELSCHSFFLFSASIQTTTWQMQSAQIKLLAVLQAITDLQTATSSTQGTPNKHILANWQSLFPDNRNSSIIWM